MLRWALNGIRLILYHVNVFVGDCDDVIALHGFNVAVRDKNENIENEYISKMRSWFWDQRTHCLNLYSQSSFLPFVVYSFIINILMAILNDIDGAWIRSECIGSCTDGCMYRSQCKLLSVYILFCVSVNKEYQLDTAQIEVAFLRILLIIINLLTIRKCTVKWDLQSQS